MVSLVQDQHKEAFAASLMMYLLHDRGEISISLPVDPCLFTSPEFGKDGIMKLPQLEGCAKLTNAKEITLVMYFTVHKLNPSYSKGPDPQLNVGGLVHPLESLEKNTDGIVVRLVT